MKVEQQKLAPSDRLCKIAPTHVISDVIVGILLVTCLFDVFDELAVEAVAIVLILAYQRLHHEPQTPAQPHGC